MACNSSKKRKASASPMRSTTAKRQQPSTRSSERTAQSPRLLQQAALSRDANSRSSSKEKRIPTPFSATEDWIFRIKVISTSTNLNDELFKRAVEGLVKICFPQGILDELGVDIVAQHMHEEEAPRENIKKMAELFRFETVNRIIHMLSQYLDTLEKVQQSVESIIAASIDLHGDELGEDLRSQIADKLTLGTSNGAEEARQGSENSATTTLSNNNSRGGKAGPEKSTTGRLHGSAIGDEHNKDIPAASIESVEPIPTQETKDKDKHVSASWRWDIEPDDIPTSQLAVIFKRTSDLFAYHALPIARAILVSAVPRKTVRIQIQQMLDEMPEAQYRKWIESLSKLHGGDRLMLVRVEPEPVTSTSGRRVVAETPAPIDARIRAHANVSHSGSSSVPLRDDPHVKVENIATTRQGPQQVETERPPHEVTVVEAAMRRLSTEERIHRAQDSGAMRNTHKGFEGKTSKSFKSQHETPIIDLLWGSSEFQERDRKRIVESIMDNLSRRIPADSIGISCYDGSTMIQSKAELREILFQLRPTKNFTVESRLRILMEWELEPWVLAKLNAFPELIEKPFVLVNIMPGNTVVLDLFLDPSVQVSTTSWQESKHRILDTLKKRKIPEYAHGSQNLIELRNQLVCILKNPRSSEIKDRHLLERLLRRVAFRNYNFFQDLKFSAFVKSWERLTGLSW